MMRIGFALPQVGGLGGPENIATACRTAESLGYASMWVNDRVLWPTEPQAPFPATADGSLHPEWRHNLDALDTLTFAAAHTSTVQLGTSVLILPIYDPVLLARRLTTIDVLSGGRLVAGLGLGWSPDEYEATGTGWSDRAKRMEDSLELICKIWDGGAVAHDSPYTSFAESIFEATPVGRPPVYLSAYSPPGLARIAAIADGWMPAGVPIPAMREMFGGIRAMAEAAGRDPGEIGLIVRGNCTIVGELPQADRLPFVGSIEQIVEDVHACEEIGASEVFLDVQFSPDVDDFEHYIDRMGTFAALNTVPV